MSFIQTAQNIDLSHSTVTYVAGDQYNKPTNAKVAAKEGQPPHALHAAFDGNEDRTRCLRGTRRDILNQIFRWIGIKNARDDGRLEGTRTYILQHVFRWTGIKSALGNPPTDNSCVFWVSGSAGTGKTTISYTVAEECRNGGILGASFFCSRDDPACSDPGLIFTTIAYQLGVFNPSFQFEMSRVMMAQPDIRYASISYQIEQLIVNPLRSLAGSIRPCVVVVDALDECRDSGTPSIILSSLARYATELSPLKFLVTSRPENHITTAFRAKDMIPAARRLVLHEVQLDVVQDDITAYLSSKLASTRDAYDIQHEWPAMEDVRELSRLSHGLFIFAATSVKFIEDRNYSDPRGQLADLLNAHPETDDRPPHVHLYRLYTQVLEHAFPHPSPDLLERLKIILGSVVLIREPLSPLALEHLIGLKPSTVREALVHVHSIIIVPEKDTQTIRLLHPSFFDFITNPILCQSLKFVVDTKTQHTFLARACLQAMMSLRRDICGIKNAWILNSEVDDLSARIEESILPHVQYACRHWASHLAQSTFSEDVVNLVEELCTKKLLNWLEVCSLLGELRSSLLSLNASQQAILTSYSDVPVSLQLLRDCEHFTLEFFPIISSCALQVYRSALLFTPTTTAMRKAYGNHLDASMMVYNSPDETWNPCLRVMEGHTGAVYPVAFSPSGTHIVSGSRDKTLRLWDAISGAHLITLNGHSGFVKSVAFSPDGTRIVSGSWDKTVRLWDAVSGALLVTLRGHSTEVTSVAFSPDSIRIVSGSCHKTLRLWSAVDGSLLVTLRGHTGSVHSVAFSPDGTRIVSGSWDKTLRLWDAVSSALLVTLRGHSSWVTSIAFSPDGTRIVSGSDDKTLCLWDAVSGAHLTTLSGHIDSVKSVAFSPDANYIVSGSDDRTVWLWDAISGSPLVTLSGHSSPVHSVAFSPDGTRIVSGSWDSTIRLWVVDSSSHLVTLSRHSAIVESVAFSPDCTRIVSGSRDKTIRLWDAVSGAHLATLSGHSGWVKSVAFSPDGTRILSGSWDKTLRLWDAVSGEHLITLYGHVNFINCVAFSPHGTHIVSAAFNGNLRLWNVVGGASLATLSGHSGTVNSVAFSPDGTLIVSGSWDQTIRLWNTVRRAHLITLIGHSGRVMSVAFSPDGTRVVSGADDNTLRLWDAVSGSPLGAIQGCPQSASSLAQSLSSSWTSFSVPDAMPSASTCPIFGYLTDDGWIYSMALNRRICWVPRPFRPCGVDVTKDSVVFGTYDGGVVILCFKNISKSF